MRTGRHWRPHGLHFKGKLVLAGFPRAAMVLALLAPIPFFLSSFLAGQSAAQSVSVTQNDVEAAYLYNFGKFVRWPANAQPNGLNICILGQDPFGATLDHILANEVINGHPVAAIRLSNTDSVKSCSILFLGNSEAPHLEEDLSALAQLPILTVSDMPEFIQKGGMVQFVLKDHRVRFEVNLNATDKCSLVLSSQLLKVAELVVGKPTGRGTR